MTDDMDMAGLADFLSQSEAGLRALEAGNDLVMSSTYQQQIPVIVDAVRSGKYPEAPSSMLPSNEYLNGESFHWVNQLRKRSERHFFC